MKYDCNTIGRELFRILGHGNKYDLSYGEIRDLYYKYRFQFLDIVKQLPIVEKKLPSEYGEKDIWVKLLKHVLLICYINNVDLNKYFEITTKK